MSLHTKFAFTACCLALLGHTMTIEKNVDSKQRCDDFHYATFITGDGYSVY
jgi:hypothetical protein